MDKPSRKLRKERKNRAKKVNIMMSILRLVASPLACTVPWDEKTQGCRAAQEGKIVVGRYSGLACGPFLLLLHCMSCEIQNHMSLTNTLCEYMHMPNPTNRFGCDTVRHAGDIKWSAGYPIIMSIEIGASPMLKNSSKNRTSYGLYLGLLDTPRPRPTSESDE